MTSSNGPSSEDVTGALNAVMDSGVDALDDQAFLSEAARRILVNSECEFVEVDPQRCEAAPDAS